MSKKTRKYRQRLRKALPKLKAYAARVEAEKIQLKPNEYPIKKEIAEVQADLERFRGFKSAV